MDDLEQVRVNARQLSADDWQAFSTREAAKAIGQWLEARGKLDQPIKRLTRRDLDAMADSAISRWVVVASVRLKEGREDSPDLSWLMGC